MSALRFNRAIAVDDFPLRGWTGIEPMRREYMHAVSAFWWRFVWLSAVEQIAACGVMC